MNRMTDKNMKCFYKNEAITEDQMKLVYRAAWRLQEYIPQEMPWEDVIQYGLIGLIKALRKYEAGKGRLSRFAGFYIYGNMIDGIFQFQGVKRYRVDGRLNLKSLPEEKKDMWKKAEICWSKMETDSTLDRIDERLSLQQAMMKLSSEERELIDAYYFQHQSWTDYANEKFVNVEWVYLMHRRILKKLRKWLEY